MAKTQSKPSRFGFLWGLAEGTFFFIVPDVFIGFAALRSVGNAAKAWMASIAGSLCAILGIHLCMVWMEIDYLEFLIHIPGISQNLLDQVSHSMAADGLPYSPLLVSEGVPLKVFGAVAFQLSHSLPAVLLWTLFARLVRIAPTFLIFAGLRRFYADRIDARPTVWYLGVAIFWLLFYIFYFWRMSQI
jgi:hypothetical protein